MSKKTWILIGCLVLSLTLGLGGSLAYLTDTDTKVNTFTMGKVDISVKEENFTDGDPLKPGLQTDKDAYITNNGRTAAWVWMTVEVPAHLKNYVTPVWAEGVTVHKTADDAAGTKIYTVLVDSQLAAGATTNRILDAVLTSGALDTKDNQLVEVVNGVSTPITGDLEVTVKAYAVQADGIESVTAAYTAYNNQWSNAQGGSSGDDTPVEPTVMEVSTLDTLRNAINAGGNVKLLENITIPEGGETITVPEGKTVVLDLNGKTITAEGEGRHIIQNWGTMTIQNGTVKGCGQKFAIKNESVMTVENITVVRGHETGAYGISNSGDDTKDPAYYATLTIKGQNNNVDGDIFNWYGYIYVGNQTDPETNGSTGKWYTVTYDEGNLTIQGRS